MTPGITLNRLLGIIPKPPRRILDVIALVAHDEKWVWIYEPRQEYELLKSVCEMAANPELSFTHYDAGMISHKVRQIACERKHKEKK